MMKQPQQASTRVVFNTFVLYAKMLITMVISLYSARLILDALGASDYGIFNLIGGVIFMLSFLNSAMSVSTQRYLSFHQGSGDFNLLKKIFTNSWVLHIGIGVVVVLVLLAFVPFLFHGFLNIPADRIPTAKVVYYFMTASMFFAILTVPFAALLNAHENMLWIAVVNIIDSVLKLAVALSLVCFFQSERLPIYGLLTACLSLATFLMYAIYCLKRYNECSVKKYQIDKPLIKELSSFAGWNLFGALCSVGRSQGLAVILNVFLGTIVNAAYGIANNVSSQLSFFSQMMLKAINPQIAISEGMNDRQRMLRITMMACKFGFFLEAFIAIPVIFEMPEILRFWLKSVPENTVIFCILIIIASLASQLTVGLPSAVQAIGKIKAYQTVVGSIILFNLPIAYILLKTGFPAYSIIMSVIFIELVAGISRLLFIRKLGDLSIWVYFKRVFLKEIIPLLTTIVTCWIITESFDFNFRFLLTGIISTITFAVSIYFTGLCEDEKVLVNTLIRNVFIKVFK